jgi:cell division protein FtsL
MSNRNYYINGTTVRELEAAPVRRVKEDPREAERRRKERIRKNAARRNRERAMHMNRGYVAFLTLCVMISVFCAFTYVKLQADVTYNMKHIASLKEQVADLKADNDANYKRITTSVDLNQIKEVAMNELGMSYATEEQVVYYTIDNTNFMDQYSDIPEK